MSQNGAFNGHEPWRPGLSRHSNAWPELIDGAEVAELRQLERKCLPFDGREAYLDWLKRYGSHAALATAAARLDREAWRRLAPEAVDEIEGYGCLTPDELSELRELELGAARDLEVWGCNPFEED